MVVHFVMDDVTLQSMTTEEQLLWLCRTMNQLLQDFEPLLQRARKKGKLPPVPSYALTEKG